MGAGCDKNEANKNYTPGNSAGALFDGENVTLPKAGDKKVTLNQLAESILPTTW